MKTVYVFFTGFIQGWQKKTGLERIWREVRKLSDDDTWVLPPLPWNTNTTALAKLIHRNVSPDARIVVIAYSWGVGHAFIHFAANLALYGLAIDKAILCDGVYRSSWLPWWLPLNPTSLLLGRKILIPPNVKSVSWVRQKVFRPCGADLIAIDPAHTSIDPGVCLNINHLLIDDSEEFLNMVLDAVGVKAQMLNLILLKSQAIKS